MWNALARMTSTVGAVTRVCLSVKSALRHSVLQNFMSQKLGHSTCFSKYLMLLLCKTTLCCATLEFDFIYFYIWYIYIKFSNILFYLVEILSGRKKKNLPQLSVSIFFFFASEILCYRFEWPNRINEKNWLVTTYLCWGSRAFHLHRHLSHHSIPIFGSSSKYLERVHFLFQFFHNQKNVMLEPPAARRQHDENVKPLNERGSKGWQTPPARSHQGFLPCARNPKRQREWDT